MKPAMTLLATAMMLGGCQANQESLSSFIEQTKQNSVGKIDPMPRYAEPPKFAINPAEIRDPFIAPNRRVVKKQPIYASSGPNRDRPREALEFYDLETLSLAGVMSAQNGLWALVKNEDGKVTKAVVGDHVGTNFGQIVAIEDTRLVVKQWFGDDFSGWRTESTTVEMASEDDTDPSFDAYSDTAEADFAASFEHQENETSHEN